jgi:Fic family protein
MNRGITGDWHTTRWGGEEVRAFVPKPLPPIPPLEIDNELRELLDEAILALGRLDSVTTLLPDTGLFLYSYVRKEAVLSSQIEGTQSSLSDLLLFEIEQAPGVPFDDVTEVSNYVAALEHGLKRIHEGFPLSNRLIREIHEILLSKGRGATKEPGEFRRTQNWIGGTRPGTAAYVPPPPTEVLDCMSALERFLHNQPEKTSTLLKAALSHVQFETIHPFLDGNGRVGRLLITLLFCVEGKLSEPLLYLSLYLKQHRSEYYDLLSRVRFEGDWEAWLRFFAEGVRVTAATAVETARDIVRMFERDRKRIQELPGRGTGSFIQIHQAMQERPIADLNLLVEKTKLSAPTITKTLASLCATGILREVTGKKRNRVYAYDEYLKLLASGT